ncbi:DUF6817 domain-containing protein [Pseudoalteromonas luteoviolacea]|uniref:DUF6817 domain-containing protein n=1 Tax=Pseudoalteromonas luteoviolacea S4054 TaxID=1129367 RepID=A0A0F6AAR0_9GAMM|nr:hypothetical protein [Pseudoalteromonas luteoviolacea]AOT08691.1 hypothetical protein S4054249_12875 [Pseudoalteromonas luteoviolacea]AOT13606.1 hypothetical protein S40542_12850 [Pseudoalteromonas luteoviolacea]AOT18519.1 hypothetical protein S4054_12850 [Pseudoalteromonas luteoviolacea]KKE82474.1 hypothetical protein N479_17865 [Pseudoalteromonas luteoviolacea S4054]KZN72011.1 hypothetical protein N481_16500 [Pseudoalteromonas luteoviolacea S4047-1]
MDKRFKALASLNASDFQHLNGDLESHLKGTASILKSWGASELLQTAGLFHAAYGTAGFDMSMVSLEQRDSIAKTIGKEEEALVYLYCSCDRSFVFHQFGHHDVIQFKDRFNGQLFPLHKHRAKMFCELTVANELELVYASEVFKFEHGKGLYNLFARMEAYLTDIAIQAYKSALGDVA